MWKHPIFNQAALAIETNNSLKLLLDLLQSAESLRGSLTIIIVNSLAAIARRRSLYYDGILSALLGFSQNDRTLRDAHTASVRYSLRTAFLGFLKCNHPSAVESRDVVMRRLRSMSPGEAIEQAIRQVEKMSRIERMSRDVQPNKDGEPSGDSARMRSGTLSDDISSITEEMPLKRMRFTSTYFSTQPDDRASDLLDTSYSASICYSKDVSTPVEKMIAMIGALLAEGDRGSESLEILISNIHADLLADIVLETMRHLPKNSVSSSIVNENSRGIPQISPMVSSSNTGSPPATILGQFPALSSQFESTKSASSEITMPTLDMPALSNILADFKRNPRRDPRRVDPRLAAILPVPTLPVNSENDGDSKSDLYQSASNLTSSFEDKAENPPASFTSKEEDEHLDSTVDSNTNQLTSVGFLEVEDTAMEEPSTEVQITAKSPHSTVPAVEQELTASMPSETPGSQTVDANLVESDQYSSPVPITLTSEDTSHDLPVLSLHVDLTIEEKKALCKLAIARILKGSKKVCAVASGKLWLPLLARLVAQGDADVDIVSMLRSHVISECDRPKGHELTMHVLYHMHAIMISKSNGSSSFAAVSSYEKFFLSIATGLLDSFPPSEKSFSKLLGEAPFLPESILKLLENVCYSSVYDHLTKDVSDGDRATQGLGALWSLILTRPSNRPACLEIALKSAVHAKEEVRTKAIRLVVNKLYPLHYASDNIENFARKMLLSVVDQVSVAESQCVSSSGQKIEACNYESSIGGSENLENGANELEAIKDMPVSSQNLLVMSSSQVQQKTSLFFALCSKNASLFKHVFDIYGRAPKAVKQSIHRHVPILLRNLGPSPKELQNIVSNPPEGCENLITLVLKVITEESTVGADLIAAVKHLYETRMQDARILIPILSSLSKDEVLPIFPKLVDLPIEKFQAALACILQGSAHSGPALTPVEVLTAIHDINPDKDGVALKKVTDACTACFEQRTVFTQQVLEKSLNSLVDKAPLPLLLMRTVIQTIDAFPTMVDFMMGILSRLVVRQIWRMPKLWVGFLKCAAQTRPHSFNVLLQLPIPQLEGALNKYPEMKVPLASYANQPNIRSTLSRQTLGILGLEQQ
ncbi:hypothetical protein KSP39_PZI023501 [Platanthera zijinensis]|uniref:Symplekin n=1 Tax=Platanthera zijinensis TaxID=2320716 RepID=A0AAP0ASV4_9ASPA